MLPRGSSRLYGPRVDCEPNVGVGTPTAHAQIGQLGGMSPRLDVVLHPKVYTHKKTSHFSVSKKWEAVQLGDGPLLAVPDSHVRHSRAAMRLRTPRRLVARACRPASHLRVPRRRGARVPSGLAPPCVVRHRASARRAVPRPLRAIPYL